MLEGAPISNRLLAALPAEQWNEFREAFRPVEHAMGEVIWQPGAPIDRVYFPTAGILSSVVVMQDGGTVEAWLTGREGAAGLEAAFGLGRASWRLAVQAPGTSLSIAPADLEALVKQAPEFQRLVFRYTHTLQQQATQSLACNRFHPIAQRLARWLLMTSDRQDDLAAVQVSHEFLAQMLGVTRPSVTVALATHERDGLIHRSGRRRIEVLDRAGLQRVCCECYARTQTETDLIFR